MLEALKNQSESRGGGSTTVISPLDQARQKSFNERQALRLEQRKAENAKISRLEADFHQRLNSKISQYGYLIFENIPSYDNVLTGSISNTYKLGVGDELIVTLQGSKSQSYTVKVDLEGRVIIPDLRPISVTGISLGEFKSILTNQVQESIIGTEVYVSLASVRSISVLVVGEVGMPGLIRTSSLASPLEILISAGGVKKTGSLRNITIVRDGKNTVFDIYQLLNGVGAGFETLNDGDRIIVPTIGATIALDGEMVRPGIYELPSGANDISIKQAMSLAGGTLRPSGYEISQVFLDDTGKQHFSTLKDDKRIRGGEVLIASLIENSQSGKVELAGHVKTPGYRSLAGARSVNSLIGDVNNFKDDPYLLFGLIERVEEKTQTRYLEAFSPEKTLNDGTEILLKDRDKVIFLGRPDIAFLISEFVRDAIVTGEYSISPMLPDGKDNPKFCLPLKNLARIINDTQSNRFATATRAVFVRKEVEEAIASKGEDFGSSTPLDRPLDQQILLKQMAEEKEKDTGNKVSPNCPEIYKEVNNLLPFILEYIVSVDGAIRLPGVYPVTQNTPISSLIAVSGGTSNDANMTNIEVTSLDPASGVGGLEMKWTYIDARQTDLKEVNINPGGGIRVGSKYSNFEAGAVLLSGEFIQPGVYTIRKGEKLSDLISRAGGVTDQAYTYGAIFTRNRVKEIQRAELEKTARHLQSAMISASVKKNIEAESLMAAQQLTNQLANAELIGRVVIEADPLKLSLSPALDTVLEAGDSLYMPKRPNFIIAMGDVLNPGALQFIPGKGISEYIDEVGSYTGSADEGRIYIVYPNGVAKPINLSSWGGDRDISIPPGTAIVVPTDLSPYDTLSLVREIGGIFQNLAVSAASIAVLIRN
ncbi:MAG: SLBB domain-containing protein [Emcibacter sp.]|nr:SLBB domain-containing protein [Emcibacter sp.]